MVHLYEPSRKVDNILLAVKHAKRHSIAEQTLIERDAYNFHWLYWTDPGNCNSCFQIESMSESFYKNVRKGLTCWKSADLSAVVCVVFSCNVSLSQMSSGPHQN